MAKIDGRVDVIPSVDSTTGLLIFEGECVAGWEHLLCAVCHEEMVKGKVAAVMDTHRQCALCQLAADPENGEALRSHVMHTWCAEVATGLEACPACLVQEEEPQPKARIARIGFDVGGVIVRHREDSEEDSAGLTQGARVVDHKRLEKKRPCKYRSAVIF